jgi:KRAB domain-containing zinc finger protein
VCDVAFKHVHELRTHLNDHLDVNSFTDINLHTKEFLFEPTQAASLANEPKENLINYIANEIATGDKQRLYTIYKRSTGHEMNLSDSETESEGETTAEEQSLSGGKSVRRQHQCSLCHTTFDRIDKIMDHLVEGHVEDADSFKDRCELCQKVFPNTFILQRHVVAQCGNQKKAYKCESCDLKFMWEDNLRLHYDQCGPSIESIKTRYRKTETGELVCELCEKTFLRKEYLMRHMMTHVPNERKFECPDCHKKFNRKDNLRSHLKTHSKDQDMPVPEGQLCVYCGRNFSNSSNLIVHMR